MGDMADHTNDGLFDVVCGQGDQNCNAKTLCELAQQSGQTDKRPPHHHETAGS